MPPAKGAAYPIFVPKTDADRKKSALAKKAPTPVCTENPIGVVRRGTLSTKNDPYLMGRAIVR
jgi:hypothetical protein